MRSTETLLEPPEQLVVSVASAALDARIDGDALDTTLEDYILAATGMCEHETKQKLVTQVWRTELDDWPSESHVFRLAPAKSAKVSYLSGGQWVPLAASAFVLYPLSYGAQLLRELGTTSWPVLDQTRAARVRVDITCGFGEPKDVPEQYRRWIRAHVGSWVQNPQAFSEREMKPVPGLDRLLDGRIWVP